VALLGSGEFWWVLVDCLVLVDSGVFCLLGSGRCWWVVGFVVERCDIHVLETFLVMVYAYFSYVYIYIYI
jgi:hypothetical protein